MTKKTKSRFMETGEALKIVWEAADKFRALDYALMPQQLELALDIVEDLIVNNFGEEDGKKEKVGKKSKTDKP